MTREPAFPRPVADRAVAGPPPPNAAPAAVWAWVPTLGNVKRQSYLGRIVVEVFGDEGCVLFMGADQTMVGRVVSALTKQGSFLHAAEPWPVHPITRSIPSGKPYQGRVIAELWDKTNNIAISVSAGSAASLLETAKRILQQRTFIAPKTL